MKRGEQSKSESPPLGTIMIYARDVEGTATFYRTHFGLVPTAHPVDGLIILESPSGGASIAIHRAAKSVKLGQVAVKLAFDVQDVEAFKVRSAALGLVFGATHQAGGYTYANAKDPDKNAVSISSRIYRSKKT
jgi:predicted enzyme related to lactoylglutathione lyase